MSIDLQIRPQLTRYEFHKTEGSSLVLGVQKKFNEKEASYKKNSKDMKTHLEAFYHKSPPHFWIL